MNTRVLLITKNFPPTFGGMERLIWNLHREVSQCHEIDLIAPLGAGGHIAASGFTREIPLRPLSRFLILALLAAANLARRRRPALCIAGSGLMAPHAVIAGWLSGSPALVYVHGLDLIFAHRLYQLIFVPFIRRAHGVIVNSHNTARLAATRGVRPERIHVLHPGVELPVSESVPPPPPGKVILSVGRLVPRKGLREFLLHAFPRILAAHPDTRLMVVGGEPDGGRDVREELARLIAERQWQANITLAGEVDEATLATCWRSAALFIFPVLDLPGDVEGFGMVAVEAAAQGVPTVAFRVGGIPDAVGEGRSGWLVPAGDYADFAARINRTLAGETGDVSREACMQFARQFSWERFGARLEEILQSVAAPAGEPH